MMRTKMIIGTVLAGTFTVSLAFAGSQEQAGGQSQQSSGYQGQQSSGYQGQNYHDQSYRDQSYLGEFARAPGNYRLTETRKGFCEEYLDVGAGGEASVFSAGNYEFPYVNEGKQTWNNSEEKGWSKTTMKNGQMIHSSQTTSKHSGAKMEEKTILRYLDDQSIELEHRHEMNAHRNHERMHNRCRYAKTYDEGNGKEFDAEDSKDQSQDGSYSKDPSQSDEASQNQDSYRSQSQGQSKGSSGK